MGNMWIRFGCFLTGYNYGIVRNSSEIAAKAVKRYTSAILIVCIMWAFIGYSFTERYLDGDLLTSIVGAIIAVIIIIQIERQIILNVDPSKSLLASRALIAIMMSIIGAVIIDQIIFKDDIDLKKYETLGERVDKELPRRTAELRSQITSLDSTIIVKENERLSLIADIEKNPTIKSVSSETKPQVVKQTNTDSTGVTTTTELIKNTRSVSVTNIANPKISMIEALEQNIEDLGRTKAVKEKELINARRELEVEVGSKVGFLDELEVMYQLVTGSTIALIIWFIWFFFLLGLELLVLISKATDKGNDYEKTVKHQMDLQVRKLDALARAANVN